jgi:HEAT repeat protein
MAGAKSKRDELGLSGSAWGLPRAKEAASKVLAKPALVKRLIEALLSDDSTLRWHAADTARRISEREPALLSAYADEIVGVFSESSDNNSHDNWRARAHLGLVAARVARSPAERLRVAGLLMPLYRDPSNVVRCTAIEGLGILARHEASLRPQFETIAEEAMASGTLAMKNRAQHGLIRIQRIQHS